MFAVLDPTLLPGQSGSASGTNSGLAPESRWKQAGRSETLR